MALCNMSPGDRRVIVECLIASADGPFFSALDFLSLFGLSRQHLRDAANLVSRNDGSAAYVGAAISGVLVNLVSVPISKGEQWHDWISCSPAEVAVVGDLWFSLLPKIKDKDLVVHGPAFIDGHCFSVVEYSTSRGGGGWESRIWRRGRWLRYEDGPGCPRIMEATPASPDELAEHCVDCLPLPEDYDPHAADDE